MWSCQSVLGYMVGLRPASLRHSSILPCETRCLSVGYQTGILNLHEIGIVGHEVEAFGYCLK